MYQSTASEFYNQCSTSEKQVLAQCLSEDGLIYDNPFNDKKLDNLNDQIFQENLLILSTKRHSLTLEQENYINNLANKFRFI